MSIAAFKEKVKRWIGLFDRRDVFAGLLIVVVGTGGFGLGMLAGLERARPPMTLEQAMAASVVLSSASTTNASTSAQATADKPATGGEVVASKNSDKWHHPYCSGAQRIKEENKIWFASVEEAEKQGYTKAANCN